MSRPRAGQAGMTIVEVLVAATILLVGISATFAIVSRGQRLGSDAQRQQQAVELGQAEIEKLGAIPYDSLGMTAAPAVTATTCNAASVNPSDWLRAGSPAPTLLISTNYRNCSGTVPTGVPTAGEPLVVCGTTGAPVCGVATVAPGPTTVDFGAGTTAKVFRFVSWRQETTCTSATAGCTTVAQASKRVSVAVALDPTAGSGVREPIWTSTITTKASGT